MATGCVSFVALPARRSEEMKSLVILNINKVNETGFLPLDNLD
jgi:hypothetical protein